MRKPTSFIGLNDIENKKTIFKKMRNLLRERVVTIGEFLMTLFQLFQVDSLAPWKLNL